MTILGGGKFCDGGTYTVIDNNGRAPDGRVVAKWLHKLNFDKFCDALQAMVDDGSMCEERADKTYNAYANNHEIQNAYEEV